MPMADAVLNQLQSETSPIELLQNVKARIQFLLYILFIVSNVAVAISGFIWNIRILTYCVALCFFCSCCYQLVLYAFDRNRLMCLLSAIGVAPFFELYLNNGTSAALRDFEFSALFILVFPLALIYESFCIFKFGTIFIAGTFTPGEFPFPLLLILLAATIIDVLILAVLICKESIVDYGLKFQHGAFIKLRSMHSLAFFVNLGALQVVDFTLRVTSISLLVHLHTGGAVAATEYLILAMYVFFYFHYTCTSPDGVGWKLVASYIISTTFLEVADPQRESMGTNDGFAVKPLFYARYLEFSILFVAFAISPYPKTAFVTSFEIFLISIICNALVVLHAILRVSLHYAHKGVS